MAEAIKLNIKPKDEEIKESTPENPNADILALNKQNMSIEDLLIFTTEHNCSDLYIKTFEHPYISRFGRIVRVPCVPITKDTWSIFYDKYILNELNACYVRQKLLDTSVSVRVPETSPNYGKYPNNCYRYRVSFGFSEERNVATFRMIKPDRPTFDTINYNDKCVEALRRAYNKSSGICYMTGPTGSGKSTTMAACINTFTQPGEILDNKVFITLEDPIENMFESTDSVKISQKELGKDFLSFGLGIKAALREHPNIIIVGECRDKEVICAAIEAARTGHVTSTTFHASDVAGTVNRLLYHLDNDKNLSLDLILQLNIILSQKMLKSNGKYLVDTQFMLFDDKITARLVDLLDDPDANLAKEINAMIQDPELQAEGLVKDWDYKELH
jgi:twitching motility protein PilT